MTNKLTRMINGNVVERMVERFEVVDSANQQLQELVVGAVRYITEVHGYMQRLESQLEVMQSKVEDMVELSTETNAAVLEAKTTNHIGKKPEFLKPIKDEVAKLTADEIRQTIHGAARRQPTGYNTIYLKIREMTGIDVFAVGKIAITKADGLGFVNKSETYINAIFKKGVQNEAGAIALDIIRNK